jgi:hypothetical protein
MISALRSDGNAHISLTLFYYFLGQLQIDPEPYLITNHQLSPQQILMLTNELFLTLLSVYDKVGHTDDFKYVCSVNYRIMGWGISGYGLRGI